MNLPTLPARVRPAAVRPGPAGWPAGARSWFAAVGSLMLGTNAMYARGIYADGFYDLYAGRYIVHHGIPRWNVVTSVDHGAPWIDQQWLAHVLYYGTWAAGGYPAMGALSAVVVTTAFMVLALLMLRRGVPPPRMLAWTLGAFLVYWGNMLIRAQSFAYLFFALTLWLLVEDDGAPRLRARTWLVVPVLVLWANMHGSVLLGVVLVALYAGHRAVRTLRQKDLRPIPAHLTLAGAAAASVVCTPYGSGVLRYYGRFVSNPALTHYPGEWSPPSLLNPFSWAFFGLVAATAAAVVVAAARRRGRRPDPVLFGLAAVLLVLALTAVRHQAWFGFGGSLLAADTLARSDRGRVPVFSRAFRRAAAGVLGALALTSVGMLTLTPGSTFESLIPRRAIDVAAAAAAKSPGVRVLGDDWAGTPMLWLHPAMFGRVGFDIRVEQYSAAQISADFDFMYVHGPRWQRVMAGYGIVVVSRRQRPLLAATLLKLPGWRVVYHDRNGLVLQRQVPA